VVLTQLEGGPAQRVIASGVVLAAGAIVRGQRPGAALTPAPQQLADGGRGQAKLAGDVAGRGAGAGGAGDGLANG